MNPPFSTLLSVDHLVLGVPGRERIVDDVSLSVGMGEFVAVVGESGSGKTMIARSILGLLPAPVCHLSGTITLQGTELTNLNPHALRKLRGARIGMVFQEPMASLNPAMRIGASMAQGLKQHTRMSAAEIRDASLAMLRRIGIDDPARCLAAYPHEFSGGMRQRIMLASVMLLKPALLIADEPTTALDTVTQREVMEVMVELTREAGTAVLLITHNLGLVARYSNRAIVLCRGREIEKGAARTLLQAPRDPYTRQLIAALPRREVRVPVAREGMPLLSVIDLEVVHPGRRGLFGARSAPLKAVDRVSFDIFAGETVAIVGGSGSGKTTLGRAIVQLVRMSGGQLLFRGRDVLRADGAQLKAFRRQCQMVFQDPYSSLDPRMRISAIVAEPLRHLPEFATRTQRERRVEDVLAEVGLAGFGRRFAHQLSGGQRQRAAIARAIVTRPALIVADEPISALDMTLQKQVLALFQQLQSEHGFACIFISHDLAAVEQISDRVLVMHKGRAVETGERDAVFDAPQHPYTRTLLDASPHVDLPAQPFATSA
ncbi:ABC transporter ATP-binding protein [Caballeronia sp. LjRoot34]|uniref:dipeptide ABC transporter ATP-binding protein n=1 Tax=Caballeronia sp. LjRoot34 TaxID=3342325 RepID=UPI003ECCFDEA